jgi:hypothetical protein
MVEVPHIASLVLPSGIDGVDMEENALVPTVEKINTLNAALVGIQEVATHPIIVNLYCLFLFIFEIQYE